MDLKENKGDSKNRYRLSDKIAELLGLEINKSKRYRIKPDQKKKLEKVAENPKVLVYDIETSRGLFALFGPGKQYVNHTQMVEEPAIISICWKWLGEDQIFSETWDRSHSDRKMVERFLKDYNSADLVIGYNQVNFDNRWIAAQALAYNLDFNPYVKQLDIYKEFKHLIRVPSFSMAFMTKKLDVTFKQSHEGKIMWDKVERGTKEEQEEYLGKMIEYNTGDIISTEALLIRTLPYLRKKIHFGVLQGHPKYSCPTCGTSKVEVVRHTVTARGTIQWMMKCPEHGYYTISNTDYLKFKENE